MLSKFIQINFPQRLHVDKTLKLITKGNEELTHGVPLETVVSKEISQATQNFVIFKAFLCIISILMYCDNIYILRPTEEIGLCSLKTFHLLSKM